MWDMNNSKRDFRKRGNKKEPTAVCLRRHSEGGKRKKGLKKLLSKPLGVGTETGSRGETPASRGLNESRKATQSRRLDGVEQEHPHETLLGGGSVREGEMADCTH